MNARLAALETIESVICRQRSLNGLLETTKKTLKTADRSLYLMLVYSTMRQYGALSYLRNQMLSRPLPKNQHPVGTIINLGINQLLTLNLGDHGVINETVDLATKAGFPKSKGLVNALLRRVQRERKHWQGMLTAKVTTEQNLPPWLRTLYPEARAQIALISSSPPPLTLRVRAGRARENWLAAYEGEAFINELHPQAITLAQGVNVGLIPDFSTGGVSVQDASAQHAATILNPQNGEKILDAGAAPGGKTGHLLELAPKAKVDALDHDENRLTQVAENLERLNLDARLIVGDAGAAKKWWDGKPYDAILLDAPCSGSGVLRRHPDIAFLRTKTDLQNLPKTQARLLRSLWALLKTGGRLLYCTCSILPQENEKVIAAFLAAEKTAQLLPISLPDGIDTGAGLVHLPSVEGDGFFYALLQKKDG